MNEEQKFLAVMDKMFANTSTGGAATIDPDSPPAGLPTSEVTAIIGKLQAEKHIRFLQSNMYALAETFFSYRDKLKEICEKEQNEQPAFWLSMDAEGQILINDFLILGKTNHNSINRRVMAYLLKHPNKTISREEFEKSGVLDVTSKEDKDLFVVLDDLKITAGLRKMFFPQDTSKHTLHLRNPVYRKDIQAEHIPPFDLRALSKNKK